MAKTRMCARCKALIPAERIEAIPATRLCAACSEKVGSEFEFHAQPTNLGKDNSLKKNYGSFEITKRRRKLPEE